MPELGEVAHAASILRRFLLNRTIKSIQTTVDDKVFVSPLTNESFEKELTGKKVTNVGRHGKYFWARLGDQVLLQHFGMTGWIKVRDVETHFIVMENGGDKTAKERLQNEEDRKKLAELEIKKVKDEVWPPKFYKYALTLDDGTELAFLDPRRLGKLRLLNAKDDDELMKLEPLKRLGLDFSKPENRWDLDEFSKNVLRRKLHVKTFLMDQAVFSGIGNWVADEICYQARLHPEQPTNELTEEQLAILYDKVVSICEYAVLVEGNTAAFPKDWLMLYRWGKRRKNEVDKTPEGYLIEHLTVGGRTAAFVPELQRLSGDAVASSPKRKSVAVTKKTVVKKRKVKKEESSEDDESEEEVITTTKTTRSGRASRRS